MVPYVPLEMRALRPLQDGPAFVICAVIPSLLGNVGPAPLFYRTSGEALLDVEAREVGGRHQSPGRHDSDAAHRFRPAVVFLSNCIRGPLTTYVFFDSMIVPIHPDGWGHLAQSANDLVDSFKAFGISGGQ